MKYAILQRVHDDMTDDDLELLKIAAGDVWLQVTGSATPPDEVTIREEVKLDGKWITDGTDAETAYHRVIRIAGEITLHDRERLAVEALGRAIDGMCEVLPIDRGLLVDRALRDVPEQTRPYAQAIVAAVEALR